MDELDFRKINIDTSEPELREDYLNDLSNEEVNIRRPRKWGLFKPSKVGFDKYLQDTSVSDYDYDYDAENFRNSLDFSNQEEDRDIFADNTWQAPTSSYEDETLGDSHRRDNVSRVVEEDLNKYLDENNDLWDTITPEDLERVRDIVTSGYMDSISSLKGSKDEIDDVVREELGNPFFFDDSFAYYLSNISNANVQQNDFSYIPPEALKSAYTSSIQESTFSSLKQDPMCYIISNRRNINPAGGDFLAVDNAMKNTYKWVTSIEDAEVFDTIADAEDFLNDALDDGLDSPEEYKDFTRQERLYDDDYYDWKRHTIAYDYEVQPIYASDCYNDYSSQRSNDLLRRSLQDGNLMESKIGDVVIICQEFDEMFPEGNPHRDPYTLAKRLESNLALDKETAYNIACEFLEDGKYIF